MFDDTITLLTYPAVVIRGRDTVDYTATPVEFPVAGCDIQPGASTELIAQQRQGTQIAYTVYAPLAAPITDQSVIRCAGDLCQVDGDPLRWQHGLPHQVVTLISWEPRP